MLVLSVRPSVCPLVTIVQIGLCKKTADSIEVPFGMVGRVGPRNVKGQIFGDVVVQYNIQVTRPLPRLL